MMDFWLDIYQNWSIYLYVKHMQTHAGMAWKTTAVPNTLNYLPYDTKGNK